jgi:hypothetical protein
VRKRQRRHLLARQGVCISAYMYMYMLRASLERIVIQVLSTCGKRHLQQLHAYNFVLVQSAARDFW